LKHQNLYFVNSSFLPGASRSDHPELVSFGYVSRSISFLFLIMTKPRSH
jgi:hypothetical protein